MVLYYILWANGLAAGDYKVSMLRGQLAHLTASQSLLQEEKTSMEDPTAAAKYAQDHNMVSVSNALYIFEGQSKLAQANTQ